MLLIPFGLRAPSRLPCILLLALCLLDTFNVAARPMPMREIMPHTPDTVKPRTVGLLLQCYIPNSESKLQGISLCLFSVDDLEKEIVCSPTSLSPTRWDKLGGNPISIGDMNFANTVQMHHVFGLLQQNPSRGSEEAVRAEMNPWEWADDKVFFLSQFPTGLIDAEGKPEYVISEKTRQDLWQPELFLWTSEEISVVYYKTGHVGLRVARYNFEKAFTPTGRLDNPPRNEPGNVVFSGYINFINQDEMRRSLSEILLSATRQSQPADWLVRVYRDWQRKQSHWIAPWLHMDRALENLTKRTSGWKHYYKVAFTPEDLERWRGTATEVMVGLHEP
ncbi:hypothetical protein C8R42DRAFT_728352 [Lentinula raphanica]|nr:hypothetical protein C8R42DRAFT_728352 [Lentinula raphanica]